MVWCFETYTFYCQTEKKKHQSSCLDATKSHSIIFHQFLPPARERYCFIKDKCLSFENDYPSLHST